MKKSLLLAIALGAAGMLSAPAAAVTIYTDRAAFLAAAPGSGLTDFEENAPGDSTFYDPAYVGAGFSITSSASLHTVDPAYDGLYVWNSGDVLDLGVGKGTITVDPTVRALGFDFGSPLLAPAGGGGITVNGVTYFALAQPEFNFFGIIAGDGDGALAPTTIDFNGGQGILDNVRILIPDVTGAAPEPATWLMMLAGFGLIGAALRRRRGIRAAV